MLIDQLRIEWTVNPQYSYGWAVPFVCLGLAWKKWKEAEGTERSAKGEGPGRAGREQGERCRYLLSLVSYWLERKGLGLFALCALLILPVRLILEANPNWRTMEHIFGCSVVGLTLIVIYWAAGLSRLRLFAFPVCLILAAVAWPPSIEIPIVQGFARTNVTTSIELLSLFGIPGIQYGNVIQIGAGMVGVNDACSGVRSFQSSLLVALFLGELYGFGVIRRLVLCLAGAIMAFVFNVCRISVLVWVASRQGVDAINKWHDPAGLTITMVCLIGLWAVGLVMAHRPKRGPAAEGGKALAPAMPAPNSSAFAPCASPRLLGPSRRTLRNSLVALLVWLILVQAGVEGWYRAHESRESGSSQWSLAWPPREAGFRELQIPDLSRAMLRYDEGHGGAWRFDNKEFVLYYFKWLPGKLALSSARSHSPNVCLAASGKKLRRIPDNRCPLTIHSVVFPFRRYEYEEFGQVIYVFHCLWEELSPINYYEHNHESSMMALRMNAVIEGRRNRGQRSLEFVVSGADDAKAARDAVESRLRKLVTVHAQPQ